MIVGAVGIAVGSLTWNYRHHRKWRVFLKLGGVLTLICIARFGISEDAEIILYG